MGWSGPAADALRVAPGFDLADLDTRSTPGWRGKKRAGRDATAARGRELADLQEKLYAHGRTGGDRSVLLVLQGMDTAGKGGVVRTVLGMVDPQGVALTAFGVPTPEEAAQHYLWRIRRALPAPGTLGVFDRSHYEDVLVVRVEGLVPVETWEPRFEEINAFEREVVESGTTIVKVLLAISPEEQAHRLRRRLERPHKHWKYVPEDIDARERWRDYQQAYQEVLDRTSTEHAPWHVVPADRKWFSRLAVTELVGRALEGLDLDWPVTEVDVESELARLEASEV
ncbi:polyphosphate kinase 2 family protein [Actinotalea sp. BY-33]|uniref:Polyphosphate kinase 2 family protein n=1 Tax=Actinotalea soli TaxID=2819234 RepID=A0A939LR06_9CELL|nr:PPK2 family polyphosphate kinase [Actinotalea soli]MBO1750529.1 polyphosphate kinase 2 family protein [Actinotalea soli]